MQPVMDDMNREYSYVWDITKAAPTPYQLYHIEEEPGAIDWRNAVEVPTEYYYDALRVRTWRNGTRRRVLTYWIIY